MCLKQQRVDILRRPGCHHHNLRLDLHLFHLDHKLLVRVLLNLCSHYKAIFEKFVLLEKLLVAKCFLNFEHSLMLFLILGSFLNDEISIFSRVSLQFEV
jgi:hypothetical protein